MSPESRGYYFDLSDELENNGNLHRRVISQYETQTKRALLVYHSNLNHPGGLMLPHDALSLEGMCGSLDFAAYPDGVDLYVHTNGGLPEVSARMLRSLRVRAKHVRVVVPNQALSAGTLLAIGADEIVLGPAACLGPIDPQMVRGTPNGPPVQRAAKIYIDAYEALVKQAQDAMAGGKFPHPYLQQLQQQDDSFVMECRRARDATRRLATDFLREGMMKGSPAEKITEAVEKLIKYGDEGTHGTPIYGPKAREMGLVVSDFADTDEAWRTLRVLFARLDPYVNGRGLAKYLACRHGGFDVRIQVANG